MGYTLEVERLTSGPINAILFDRKHGSMWGGSSNHGEDYGTEDNYNNRKQTSVNAKFDFRLASHTKLSLNTIYNDAMERFRLRYNFRAFTGNANTILDRVRGADGVSDARIGATIRTTATTACNPTLIHRPLVDRPGAGVLDRASSNRIDMCRTGLKCRSVQLQR